jgi:hypothetical protein
LEKIERPAVGREKPFSRVKLFCGFIYGEPEIFCQAKKRVEETFSRADFDSEVIPFDSTDYYTPEMGFPLFRRFIAFSRLISPEELSEIKLTSNGIENEFTIKGKRRINIDPGYLSEANIVIATTKNHYHRIPMKNGIYANMEYVIKKKKIVPLEWTYPDFKKTAYLNFFELLRQSFRQRDTR